MRTACTCHDTCVNKCVMRDLVELEMACNVSCPRQPSLTIRSKKLSLQVSTLRNSQSTMLYIGYSISVINNTQLHRAYPKYWSDRWMQEVNKL